MRLLMLNYNKAFVGGGSFFRSLHLGRHLARRGHRVTIMASSPNAVIRFRRREVDGVELLEAPGLIPPRWRYGYDFYEVFRRLHWLSKQHFDIVHALECRPVVIYPALAAQRHGAKLVIDWYDWFGRGGSVEQRSNVLMRTLLRPVETYYEEAFRHRANATIVVNAALEARARALGVSPATILRLPHGADPDHLRPLDRGIAREVLGLPLDVPILGYVGALFPADAVLLAEAFTRVRAVRPETLLILVGKPQIDLGLREGVIRTGFISYSAFNHYLAACDVMCLPFSNTLANQGRFPSKIADYFAVGRPTVAAAIGEVRMLLQETDAGLVADPTPESFAEQILTLLDAPVLGIRLGKNARCAAETHLSWATLAERVESLYLRLLATT